MPNRFGYVAYLLSLYIVQRHGSLLTFWRFTNRIIIIIIIVAADVLFYSNTVGWAIGKTSVM